MIEVDVTGLQEYLRCETNILHVDMDAFFAAVEQRDRPELRGKPVLVGGDPKGRGVVSTASYEARPFGCHSALPMAAALRLCPHAIVVSPRMSRYAEVSKQVFDILEEFTPIVEPLSIDEAFLDITGSLRLLGPPERIATDLKRRIFADTNLKASVGVAPNKFLAKLASDHEKPDGLVIVNPQRIQDFLDPLPISRLWGVGKASLPKFERLGIRTFADLRRMPEEDLIKRFGETGPAKRFCRRFHRLVRGVDHRTVVTDREAKSISHEVTFAVDVNDDEYLRGVLLDLTESVARRLRRHERMCRTTTLKVRTHDFTTVTRHMTLSEPTDQTDCIWESIASMFQTWRSKNRSAIRLIGAGTMNFANRKAALPSMNAQLELFETDGSVIPPRGHKDAGKLDETVDKIRDRFGADSIARGAAIKPGRDKQDD